MIRPRWRKVLADLWDNKMRSLLVVASIAVGVFSIGMIAGTYVIISHDMGASYASANPANIDLITEGFDQDFVSTIERVQGVQAAEGRRIFSVRARVAGGEWARLDLVALEDFEQVQINQMHLLSGSPLLEERELILERGALEDLPAAVGEDLEIQLPNGAIKSLPVAGVVLDQATGAGDFLAPPYAYVTFDSLEWLGQPSSYNRLFATVSGDGNDESLIRQVSVQISDRVEKSGRQVYRTQLHETNQHPMASTVQAILGILFALGILIVMLSSSLIANTLNALLTQQTPQIGMMKLVGARSNQIFSMYIVLIVIFGAIALLIAVPAGGQAAYALSQLIADEMNFELLGYRIIPLAMLIQVVIALAVPLAAGYIPVNNGSRVHVQTAISGGGMRGGDKVSWVEKIGTRFKSISRPVLISLRNTFRRKGRLALTLFTLTIGGAIFISVFNVQRSLNDYIDQVGRYFVADVTLTFDRPYRVAEITRAVLEVPQVTYIEGWAYVAAEILRPDESVVGNLGILAPPADSQLVDSLLIEGRWLQPGDQNAIAISEAIWTNFPDLHAGDMLSLKINGRTDQWTVVGIFRFVSRDDIIAYATYDYVSEQLLNRPGQSSSYRVVTTEHTLEAQKQIGAVIDAWLRERGYHVSEVEAGKSTLQAASEGLGILVTFLLIMALLTAVVGSIGLTGTMGMNVLERTREIGVMRAIGAVDRVIIKSVMTEGVIIGVISFFLAVIFSFPITWLLNRIISLAIFNSPSQFVLNIWGFLIWLGLVLILAALASALPARSAARLTIREVLAYE
jgi:putative ABC transport system permease protein